MSFSCNDLSINEQVCSVIYTPGRGSGCFSKPVAFVFHNIDTDLESYLNQQKSPYLLGEDYYTQTPKSVHYVISTTGTIYHIVENDDTAWGLSAIDDPSWPLFNSFSCSISLNEPFLHIGFIVGASAVPNQVQQDQAALLICCLALQLGMGVTENWVLVARDLDANLNSKPNVLWSVPGNIIPSATVCLANKGTDPYSLDQIYTYGSRLADLEAWRVNTVDPALLELYECCNTNAEGIAALQEQVAALEATVQEINIDALLLQISDLQAGNLALGQRLTIIESCLLQQEICDPPALEFIRYRLDYSSEVKLVPSSLQWLNLPIKVQDVNPPIVQTGPLWSARFTSCQECGTYKVTGTIRLAGSDFCVDKILRLYAVINSEEILLGEYIATDGAQSAYVTGSTIFTVPPDPTDVHLAVYTDDDTVPHVISLADITIECLDGLIVPDCACDDCV